MMAHLIDTYLVLPTSSSSFMVKVKVMEKWLSWGNSWFTNTFCSSIKSVLLYPCFEEEVCWFTYVLPSITSVLPSPIYFVTFFEATTTHIHLKLVSRGPTHRLPNLGQRAICFLFLTWFIFFLPP